MANPRSDRAMYRQIADEIRDAIRSGELAEGDMLPSEAALVAAHGTSQGTVRKAIALLRSEGWIVSESGRGVFVRRRPVVFRKGNDRFSRANREGSNGKAAFDVEIGAHGLVPKTEVTVEGPIPAPDEAATLLDLAEGDLVVARRRRMLADGEPVQLATSYVPWSIAEGTQILEENSGPGGIYARIEEAGHRLAEFSEDIRARPAFPEEADSLGIESGMPVILLTRVAYDTEGHPVEVCDCVMTADRWCLSYRFPAT
jgi:GntR family transcriptional regulator